MFPFPNKIIGDRESLIESYIAQLDNIKIKNIPKKPGNCFRFCSYNVKIFEWNNYKATDIKTFINEIDTDAFSLIEYDGSGDKYFINADSSTILFEQLPNYGIFTKYNGLSSDGLIQPSYIQKENSDKYSPHILKKMRCLSHDRFGKLKEFRGFTHLVTTKNKVNINILTVHLDVYDESGEIRLLEIKEIYDYIINHKLVNVFILGDFNEWVCKKGDVTYKSSLIDFRKRTGLDHFSTRVHTFLESKNFTNVFSLKNKYPKFSCWSGKLVDFCYVFNDTLDERLEITDIHMPLVPYSDHLPIIIDLTIN